MTNRGTQRAMIAAERRFERDSQKRRRELERLAKESAKLSAVEQARLDVETFENQLDVILSIHKEPCREWDWLAIRMLSGEKLGFSKCASVVRFSSVFDLAPYPTAHHSVRLGRLQTC
jgi:hypothetical protein